MVIQWSDEDRAYMASIPVFPGNFTHGETYEEAVKQGQGSHRVAHLVDTAGRQIVA